MFAHARFMDRTFITCIAIVLGIVGGAFVSRSWAQTSTHVGSGSYWTFPRPQSLRELVQSADLIVDATVGLISNEGTFAGYDDQGNMILEITGDLEPLAVPFVDYEVKVDQIFKDDGTLSSGQPITLRMPTNRTEAIVSTQEYPMSAPGDHHLFFLSRNPDGTYGIYYGPGSRFIIDDAVVTYSDGARTQPAFARNVRPADFIKQVATTIAADQER